MLPFPPPSKVTDVDVCGRPPLASFSVAGGSCRSLSGEGTLMTLFTFPCESLANSDGAQWVSIRPSRSSKSGGKSTSRRALVQHPPIPRPNPEFILDIRTRLEDARLREGHLAVRARGALHLLRRPRRLGEGARDEQRRARTPLLVRQRDGKVVGHLGCTDADAETSGLMFSRDAGSGSQGIIMAREEGQGRYRRPILDPVT